MAEEPCVFCEGSKTVEIDCPHCGGSGKMQETCPFCDESLQGEQPERPAEKEESKDGTT